MYEPGDEVPKFNHGIREGRNHQKQKVNVGQDAERVVQEPRPITHRKSFAASQNCAPLRILLTRRGVEYPCSRMWQKIEPLPATPVCDLFLARAKKLPKQIPGETQDCKLN